MIRGTIEHPKTLLLAALLDIPHAQAVGHIEALVHWTAKYAIRGDVGKFPNAMIAKGALWEGDPDTFIDGLLNARGEGQHGWLEEHDQFRLVVHDWHHHADNTTKKKMRRNGMTFWNGDPPFQNSSGDTESGHCPDNGRTPSGQCQDDGIPHARAPVPEPVPEPESFECSAPQGDAKPQGTPFLEFPCSGKPKTWTLTREKVEEYHGLYGHQIDVRQEAKKALQWIRDNPTRRKTARGMTKFLNGWFSRAVDRGKAK